MFDTSGELNTDEFNSRVLRKIEILSEGRLPPSKGRSLFEEAVKQTGHWSLADVRSSIRQIEGKLPSDHKLFASSVPLNLHGERGKEWAFFENRQNRLPADPKTCEARHQAVMNSLKKDLMNLMKETVTGRGVLLSRYKDEEAIRRKMRTKGLHRFEIGDILGFFLCPRYLSDLPAIVLALDHKYCNDVLYKQNGFRDSVVERQQLDRAVARRVFYIIRHDSEICFELQVVTVRQIVYIHLSHPDYIGPPYSPAQLKALHNFGDRAYLLDLIDLIKLE